MYVAGVAWSVRDVERALWAEGNQDSEKPAEKRRKTQ